MSQPQPWLDDYKAIILAAVEELACETGVIEGDPGPWTARICRCLNDLPETPASVAWCGLCPAYMNPLKRARAARLPQPLPGFEQTGGAYQAHAACWKMPFGRLKQLLHSMETSGLVYAQPLTRIPDSRNYRGWDFATVWRPCE